MSKFLITGGNKLEGEIDIAGNKNSALKLIPAVLASNNKSVLTNVPNIADVRVLLQIIEKLGAKVSFSNNVLEIDPSSINSYEPDSELCSRIRASVVLVLHYWLDLEKQCSHHQVVIKLEIDYSILIFQ